MGRSSLLKLARLPIRGARPSSIRLSSTTARRSLSRISILNSTSRLTPSVFGRSFSSSIITSKGITPESSDPQPKEPESHGPAATTPTEISVEEYHQVSDEYMDNIVHKLEQLQEEREDVDVEFSAGVLTLNFPPIGTYVLNKQPPNKQIWLSSPLSGPKRYDWVLLGEGQHEKEGGGKGDWIYLRDGSSLGQLLMKELKVDLTSHVGH